MKKRIAQDAGCFNTIDRFVLVSGKGLAYMVAFARELTAGNLVVIGALYVPHHTCAIARSIAQN